ncbi:hypothetical protein NPIL_517551 [Nephila pilipes]|uniref:Uncharacterized protein n=1 Tax=Nephila pilipes TaxID=299642 RepID=A0A8X6URE3_NEPPI|nr:hypothetical protein NPIL_517551 [Nephila pilipes]
MWKKANAEHQPKNRGGTVQYGSGSMMVSSCMSVGGVNNLNFKKMDNDHSPPSSHKPHPKRKLHMGSSICCLPLRCWVTFYVFFITMTVAFYVAPFIGNQSDEFMEFCHKISNTFLLLSFSIYATVVGYIVISRRLSRLFRPQLVPRQEPKPKPRREPKPKSKPKPKSRPNLRRRR